ncbi:MAG: hypothetical protein KDK66_04980, partial [Deltaproteobacteria bacterium]|nr:hypothetical protein [Deltaproteobacteria bacterium]
LQENLDPPVTLVEKATCQTCFIKLPPQLHIELLKEEKWLNCPNCHRLLYLPPEAS